MVKTIFTTANGGLLSYIDYVDDGFTGLKIFTKEFELSKNLIDINEEKEFLEEVNKCVQFDERLKFNDNSRYNLGTLLMAGNIIMSEGRRGPAHNILIARPEFEKILAQSERDSLQRMHKVWFSEDENLDYALVWREGSDDEPGIVLVRNEEKYAFVSVGFKPEKQYVKIKISI